MWNNRNLWILMTGETIAGLGMWVGIIGNLEFLQHTVPSDTLKSLIILIGLFVGLLLGPSAGRMADLYSKKKIMNLSGLLRIVSVLFMLAAIGTGSVWWMVVYMILLGISAAYYFPALQAAIPLVTPKEHLLQVNSFYMTLATLARVVGTALGGILLLSMSLLSMYLWTLISYAILYGLTLLLRIEEKPREASAAGAEGDGASAPAGTGRIDVTAPSGTGGKVVPASAGARPSAGASFKEVWPMLKRTPTVMTALLLTFVPALFLGGFNLVILKISELQGNTAIKGLLYTTEGLCFLVASLFVKRLVNGRNLIPLLLLCTLAFALSHGGLILAGSELAAILSFGLFGFAAGLFFPMVTTLFQKEVEPSMHGRFFSLRGMIDRLSFQLVLVLTGIMLDLVGFVAMEAIWACCSISLVLYYISKQLRKPMVFRNEAV